MAEGDRKRNRKKSFTERKLSLQEAASRRWDALVTFPFFLADKLISWPVAIAALGYFFFVLGGAHFAGVSTSLLVKAVIDLGEDKIEKPTICLLIASNVTTLLIFRAYIKRKGQREKALELELDKSRTSSGLSNSGLPPNDDGE